MKCIYFHHSALFILFFILAKRSIHGLFGGISHGLFESYYRNKTVCYGYARFFRPFVDSALAKPV